jgi:hypothetical protein
VFVCALSRRDDFSERFSLGDNSCFVAGQGDPAIKGCIPEHGKASFGLFQHSLTFL